MCLAALWLFQRPVTRQPYHMADGKLDNLVYSYSCAFWVVLLGLGACGLRTWPTIVLARRATRVWVLVVRGAVYFQALESRSVCLPATSHIHPAACGPKGHGRS